MRAVSRGWSMAATVLAAVLLAVAAAAPAAAAPAAVASTAEGATQHVLPRAVAAVATSTSSAKQAAVVQAQADPAAVPAPIALNRAAWKVTADSYETVKENGAPARCADGSATTIWHTRYTGTVDTLPHHLHIDMGAIHAVSALTYLPRQDKIANGRIGQFSLVLSPDGLEWDEVANGTFADNAILKEVDFARTRARYVRLDAMTEAGRRGQWTSAAEINILGGPDPTPPRDAWVIKVDSAENNNAGTLAVDGSTTTFWHTRYTGATPLPTFPHNFTIDTGAVQTFTSLSYLPRPPPSKNGNIGNYQIDTSVDGATWQMKVVSGTLPDTSTAKTITLPGVSARYVRLVALSEAGKRGPWTSAAEINLQTPLTHPSPNQKGEWGTPIQFPLVPVAGALLHNTGKLLTWSSYSATSFGGAQGTGKTVTATYDPATGRVTQRTITDTGHDMFCPGISAMGDGRIVVTGGDDSRNTSIYDPVLDKWVAGSRLTIPRGYQASATLSDSSIFTIGGSWSGGKGGENGVPEKNGEIYTPATNTWKALSGCAVVPMLTADKQGTYRADNHAWLFGWKNRYVFQAGPSKEMHWYTTTGTGSVSTAGRRAGDGDAMCGTAAMYDAVAGKILTLGGAPYYQDAQARANAFVITIGTPGDMPSVHQVPSMSYARSFHSSVILPNGKVVVMGGQAYPVPFSDDTAVLYPELWDPATEDFVTLAPHTIPRNYHSMAVLMQDATVFLGGGGLCGNCATNHFDGQVFSPPYLFNADGSPAVRPVITSYSASQVKPGATLGVKTNSAVTRFSLMRIGTVTHTVNTDQRRVPLVPAAAGTSFNLVLPADSGVLLPGYWMLFALNAAGVPSVAKMIRVVLA